jgi:excisionase family DNA binding protein
VPPAGSGGASSAAGAAGDVLTPAQVAAILKVAEPDVLGLLESGALQAKKIGAHWRIRRAALDAYLAN